MKYYQNIVASSEETQLNILKGVAKFLSQEAYSKLERSSLPKIQKLFLLDNTSPEEKYSLLSAFVARFLWLRNKEQSMDCLTRTIQDLKEMHLFSRAQQRMLQAMMTEDRFAWSRISAVDLHSFDTAVVINYLDSLEFPLNIKLLAESLNEGTQCFDFFKINIHPDLQSLILEKLISKNEEYYKVGLFREIDPVFALLLGEPSLREFSLDICKLFMGFSCDYKTPEQLNAVRLFLEKLPLNLQSQYRAQHNIAHFMSRRFALNRLVPEETLSFSQQIGKSLLPALDFPTPIGGKVDLTLEASPLPNRTDMPMSHARSSCSLSGHKYRFVLPALERSNALAKIPELTSSADNSVNTATLKNKTY